VTLLVAGVTGTSVGLFRARQEGRRAEANAGELEAHLYFNRIALAHREWNARPPNVKEAEQLLDQ
jgi:hypothetical protein